MVRREIEDFYIWLETRTCLKIIAKVIPCAVKIGKTVCYVKERFAVDALLETVLYNYNNIEHKFKNAEEEYSSCGVIFYSSDHAERMEILRQFEKRLLEKYTAWKQEKQKRAA